MNLPDILPEFNLFCPGENSNHAHHPVRGKDALWSQYYTPYMCSLIHLCIYRFFLGDARNTSQLRNNGLGYVLSGPESCQHMLSVDALGSSEPRLVVPSSTS